MGRPWQIDVDVTYKGQDNVYVFTWRGKKIAMVLNCNHPNIVKLEEKSFLTIVITDAEFEFEARETKEFHAVVVRASMTNHMSEILS